MIITNQFFLTSDLRLDTTRLSYRGKSSASFNTVQSYQFPPSPVSLTAGYIKYYNGSIWALKPVKYWTGSTWMQKPLKRWNGSAWVIAHP